MKDADTSWLWVNSKNAQHRTRLTLLVSKRVLLKCQNWMVIEGRFQTNVCCRPDQPVETLVEAPQSQLDVTHRWFLSHAYQIMYLILQTWQCTHHPILQTSKRFPCFCPCSFKIVIYNCDSVFSIKTSRKTFWEMSITNKQSFRIGKLDYLQNISVLSSFLIIRIV